MIAIAITEEPKDNIINEHSIFFSIWLLITRVKSDRVQYHNYNSYRYVLYYYEYRYNITYS